MIQMAQVEIGDSEIQAVTEVLKSGRLREGEKCKEFEQAFTELITAKYATTFSSGTTALHAAYLNLIQPGDEVLVPAFTFFATASMIVYAGGVPVFCDINEKTFCIDIEDAKDRITPKTSAIAPVHLFGNACDIDAVNALAEAYNLKIIWDAAQAHLTKYNEKDVGSFGNAVCYSFYATKNMTTGEGGMVTSNDENFINRCILLKHQGQSKKYHHTVMGTNYRMTDMQAAIGLEQVKKIENLTAKRRRNASLLNEGLKDLPGVTVPFIEPLVQHSYHQYTILLPGEAERNGLQQDLQENGIQSAINYPIPLHLQPAFHKYSKNIKLPVAEKNARYCLSLPVHPALADSDIEKILDCIRQHINH
jgi:perosamine synthetase